MLKCHVVQVPEFVSFIGNLPCELIVKSVIHKLCAGEFDGAKRAWIDFHNGDSKASWPKLPTGKYNCWDSILSAVYQHLNPVFGMFCEVTCDSTHCPRPSDIRKNYNFQLNRVNRGGLRGAIMDIFEKTTGSYCRKRFPSRPPANAKVRMDGMVNLVDGELKEVEYPICAGNTELSKWEFLGSNPWILPIHITALNPDEALALPKHVQLHGYTFRLSGVSMYSADHFTSFLNWHNDWKFYDGMQGGTMIELEKSEMKHKKPQYAVYMRVPA